MQKIIFSVYKKAVKILSMCGIGKFYSLKVIHNFIISNLKPNFVEVQGHKMFLDSKDTLGLSIHGIWEPFETEFIQKEIKRGDIVLDIGANIGYYTLIFAKLVGEEGKVFAFEPDPTNFTLLKKSVEINGYNNVILVQKAVSNKNEKIRLYLSKDNIACHNIYNSQDDGQSIEIESIRLDDYFKNYGGAIDFVKIDIEGAEGEAIQGMNNLLEKNKNVKIVTEFLPIGLKRSGIEPEKYLKLLIELGFKLYEINEQEKEIKLINISKLLEIYTSERENHTNLFMCRNR